MEYRNLGRTGVKVSKLCLGCFNFGNRTGEEESIEIMSRAIELGVNFLDTANSYGRGSSEILVGKALNRSGQRDRIVLATKVYTPQCPTMTRTLGAITVATSSNSARVR